jgi:hypothetical protein
VQRLESCEMLPVDLVANHPAKSLGIRDILLAIKGKPSHVVRRVRGKKGHESVKFSIRINPRKWFKLSWLGS